MTCWNVRMNFLDSWEANVWMAACIMPMPKELLRPTEWKCNRITVYTIDFFWFSSWQTAEGYTRGPCNIATAFERFTHTHSLVMVHFDLFENYLRSRILSRSAGRWDQHPIQNAQVQHSYIVYQSVFMTNRQTVRGGKTDKNRALALAFHHWGVYFQKGQCPEPSGGDVVLKIHEA